MPIAWLAAMVAFAAPVLGEQPAIPAALRTAATHASLAVGARELADVRMHLQHVLNCLEGPKGRDYDLEPGDPCGGKGALQALPVGSANRTRAQKAVELARVGVTFHDFKPAHDTALAVEAVLEEATSTSRPKAGARTR